MLDPFHVADVFNTYASIVDYDSESDGLDRLTFIDAIVKHRNPESMILMTSSNGNIFLVTGHLCAEFTGHR